MKIPVHFFAFIIIASMLLQACGGDSQSAIETAVAQTQQISQLQTAAAKGGEAEEQDEPEAQPQADGQEVSPSDTPTPAVPMITVSQTTNCRTGPASYYSYVTEAGAGEQYEVVGVWAEGDDYVIVRIASRSCWLWTRYANVKTFPGYSLTSHTTPPTPTPTETEVPTSTPTTALSAPAAPTGLTAIPACSVHIHGIATIHWHMNNVTLLWGDAADNETGYRVYRDAALLNTLPADSTSYNENPPGNNHTYGVEAFNPAGSSALSETSVACP